MCFLQVGFAWFYSVTSKITDMQVRGKSTLFVSHHYAYLVFGIQEQHMCILVIEWIRFVTLI